MKRYFTLVIFLVSFQQTLMAATLKLRVDGDHLRVSAPDMHFLLGRPLERLQNGAVVTYVLQLTVRSERAGKIVARIPERFTVSYDLWEEKFSVARQSVPARSASNLSASAAEEWCIENVSISVAQLPADRPFWVALDFSSEGKTDSERSGSEGLTLGSLVDILSRRPHDDPEIHGSVEVGPVRLEDLKRNK